MLNDSPTIAFHLGEEYEIAFVILMRYDAGDRDARPQAFTEGK
jgi:hypothetical protein